MNFEDMSNFAKKNIDIMRDHNKELTELVTACTKEMIRMADILGVDRNLLVQCCTEVLYTGNMFSDFTYFNLEGSE